MKVIIFAILMSLMTFVGRAQVMNIHKTDGSIIEINTNDIDSISFTMQVISIDDFCNATPCGWSCATIESSFNRNFIPRGRGYLHDPLAMIFYTNDSLDCNYYLRSLVLLVYDISDKDSIENVIENENYSWCIPMFFGENERYYVITSPCYLSGRCWTDETLNRLYEAIKKLFTKSIIKD